jgi:hypothetical protein
MVSQYENLGHVKKGNTMQLTKDNLVDSLITHTTDKAYVEPVPKGDTVLDYVDSNYVISEFNRLTKFKYNQTVSKPDFQRAQNGRVVGVIVTTTIEIPSYGTREANIFKPITDFANVEDRIKSAETAGFARCVKLFNIGLDIYLQKK